MLNQICKECFTELKEEFMIPGYSICECHECGYPNSIEKEPLYADFDCPLCGSKVISEDSDDMHASDYCSDGNCPWFRNQFISYEDVTEIEEESYYDTGNVDICDDCLQVKCIC